MQYYGTKLSENISLRRPEGYLLCLNVPVARSGTQEYWPEELGVMQTGNGMTRRDGMVPVYRPEEEVFATETMASFEGMPVTNDHPRDGVDIENIRRVQAGHAHNIRRGLGEESDLLLADLIITDPGLIDAILQGKREISCGYTYELHEENGQYIQRKIRGNHIAVVDAGRAGPRVSIKDHKKDHKKERKVSGMKKSLTKVLARMAKDGDAETVAEIIEELIGDPTEEEETGATAGAPAAENAGNAENKSEGAAVEIETKEGNKVTVDEDALTAVTERLDQLITMFAPLIEPMKQLIAVMALNAPAAEDEEPEEGAIQPEEIAEIVEEVLETKENEAPADAAEEVAEIIGKVLEPPITGVTEEEEEEEEPAESAAVTDALKATLLAFRPRLQDMTPRERQKTCIDIARRLYGKPRKGNDSASIGMMRRPKARRNPRDLGKRIMESRNANWRK